MLVYTDSGVPLYLNNAAFTCVKVPSGAAGLNFDFADRQTIKTVILNETFESFIQKLG